MRIPGKFRARLGKPRGQSMVEYSLVIAAVAIAALFGGYQGLANIVVSSVNSVAALF